jgi:transposase
VHLPLPTRLVCLPVLARLMLPGPKGAPNSRKRPAVPGTRTAVAVALVTLLAQAFPDRAVHVVADAAYHGPALKQLPAAVTWTCRLPANAFRAARDLLTTIPGIGPLAAAAVIYEAGADIREYFPDAAHLASWAGMCPGNHESAGKHRPVKRRKGNQHLQPVLVECAWAAARHDGYLKSLYHRHVMKWGGYRSQLAKKKAIIVVAHAILVIIWHVLATGKPYDELGEDYFTRRADPERETRRLVQKLEALGHTVTLEAAA